MSITNNLDKYRFMTTDIECYRAVGMEIISYRFRVWRCGY